jgi:thioredoxin reductase
MARTDPPRIAVLGAGPIGLEAALYAATLKVPVTIFERAQVGAHLRQWGHVRLFSPFGMDRTLLGMAAIRQESPRHEFPGDQECISGQAHLKSYLEPLAQTAPLRDCILTGAEVVQIGRRGFLKTESPGDPKRGQTPFLLLLRDAQGKEWMEEADVVLDCTGSYGRHRWMGEGGIPAPGERQAASVISYSLEDVCGEKKKTYAGRNILVVGGGYSAATTIRDLATLAQSDPATWVIWAARCSSTQPIRRLMNDPLPERDRLAQRANMLATRPEGNVEFRNQTVIESLEPINGGVRVTARCGSKKMTWEVERVIANVGYAPDDQLFRELQVHQCYATEAPMALAAALLKHAGSDCTSIPPQGANTLRTTEPGFFVLGAKSYGRNSQFLLKTGFEQVREVFTLITGKNDLDLYKGR